MTVTADAIVQPGTPVPFLQIDIAADNPAAITVWTVLRDGGGERVIIRTGTTFSGALSFEDYTAPLGVPITYTFTVRRPSGPESGASAPVTITGTTGCYLTDPYSGNTLGINLVAWPDRVREERRALLAILDRPDPVALYDAHLWPNGTWTLHTPTDAGTGALVAMLTTGIVRLRTQPGSSIPMCYVSVGRVGESRMTGRGGDQRRFIVAEIQEIAAIPDTGEDLPATLQGLHELVPTTLEDLAALRPTLRQLSMIRTG